MLFRSVCGVASATVTATVAGADLSAELVFDCAASTPPPSSSSPALPNLVIAGIVTDSGGILSHSATVAREFMMPAVVGCGTATREIKSGDRIRVDGDTGVVHLL